MKLKKYRDDGREAYHFYCPGCETGHGFRIPPWKFDGNLDFPTVEGSVLSTGGDRHCHLYVIKGQLQFLDDCHHKLKNQTIDIPEWPFGD